jgi:SAM-dependent methyltransferase
MAGLTKKILSKLRGENNNVIVPVNVAVFDEAAYLAAYPDVAEAVHAGAIASGEMHFNLHGYSEGRIAHGSKRPIPLNFPFAQDSRPNRRDKMLANLSVASLNGLEIGALSSPQVTHDEGDIIYVDHVDTETLLKKYGPDQSVDKSKIVHVDAVWGAQSLQECIGATKKVDYVVASHVIEHVPDLITWLAEIHSILRVDGSLRLAIPDRRYTFDILKTETQLQDVLEAYLRRARAPLPRQILEHFGLARIVDCAAAWNGTLNLAKLKPIHGWKEAIHYAQDAIANQTYHDSHCWIFTPVSFANLCIEMAEQDLLRFACEYHIETPRNEFEFYVNMVPCVDKSKIVASWHGMMDELLRSKSYQHDNISLKSAPEIADQPASNSILDVYVKSSPTDQNIIDLFKGEWSSTMPTGSGLKSEPGPAGLFEDGRITWADEMLGGFKGKNILELGPLEGAHSYMLQKIGANTITSIESNQRAFMKCLSVKEIFDLDRVHFKLGDFIPFLETTEKKFDAVIASGVLYHMIDPIAVLTKMARVSDKLFIWTHYFDEKYGAKNHRIFDKPQSYQLSGFKGMGAKRFYRESLNWQGFCGGSETYAVWLSKDTILNHLNSLGFNKIDIHIDAMDHPNGPAFSFSAQRN